jgi:hypothetical protein
VAQYWLQIVAHFALQFNTILKAVEAGELDQQIEVASIKLREGFGK